MCCAWPRTCVLAPRNPPSRADTLSRMLTNRYQNYFDEEVLEAHPVKLVQLLYQGALASIASARRHLRAGEIRARSRSITRAMGIVTELSLSLNMEAGGELSSNLARLYEYLLTLLIRANSEQREAPLIEAARLLSTLLEGWSSYALPEAERPAGRPESSMRREVGRLAGCAY